MQHERGPRNATLRRQMSLYFKDSPRSPPESQLSPNSSNGNYPDNSSTSPTSSSAKCNTKNQDVDVERYGSPVNKSMSPVSAPGSSPLQMLPRNGSVTPPSMRGEDFEYDKRRNSSPSVTTTTSTNSSGGHSSGVGSFPHAMNLYGSGIFCPPLDLVLPRNGQSQGRPEMSVESVMMRPPMTNPFFCMPPLKVTFVLANFLLLRSVNLLSAF